METVDASAVMLAFIVAVSLATLLMIIRVQSVLQDVLKALQGGERRRATR